MSLSGSLVDSSLPHPIMHIQSNLRPGVIDGAPLIWPGCTSASRFTTVATGRFGTSSGKSRHMHKTALARFSISFSLSQLHYNEDPHQDPASTELQTNTCNTISLFVSQQNHSTQNMNTRQHIMYILHTQHNLHPQTCTAHTHTFSLSSPLLMLTKEIYRAVEQKSGLHWVQIIIWWKSPVFH